MVYYYTLGYNCCSLKNWKYIFTDTECQLVNLQYGQVQTELDEFEQKIFDWPEYRLYKSIELDTAVANDLAVSSDGTVYITDTAKHQVIRILPDGTQSVVTGKAQFKGANGIALKDGNLYIGGERLWRVSLSDGSVETLGPDWLTDIDGIEAEFVEYWAKR